MREIVFALAGVLSLMWCVVHVVVGGREVARALRNSPHLDPTVRDTQYLCWHFTTVSIAAIAVFFTLALVQQENQYAIAGTILASGFSIVGIGLVFAIRQRQFALPQGWLFVPVAGLGAAGLMVS